jgi:hypothetical protein
MNKTELKLRVIELSKTLRRNELYDYIIAKYLFSNRESNGFTSVAHIESVTGLKIKDVVMMNKLLFYWTTMLDEEEQKQKAINILTVMDTLSKEEQNEIITQHRIIDELKSKIYKVIIDESNNAA